MVAREGSAPPISGCRPDVILFHHRAEKIATTIGIKLANNVAILQICICKQPLYAFYVIGNNIGTNDQECTYQEASRSPIGHGAAPGCRG
jgi:hypothetical protein